MKTRARKPPPPKESVVQRKAIKSLQSLGWVVLRRNTGAIKATYKGRERFVRFSEKGASDLYGFMPPPPGERWWRPFDAECKRMGERPRLDQANWLIARNELTGSAFWFDSIDILEHIAVCLTRGGNILYLPTTRKYGGIIGPSGDFDLVFGDPTP